MIKVIPYIFIALFISGGIAEDLFAGAGKTISGKPEIAFEQAVFISKGVIEGDELIHSFTVLNPGAAPLRVLKVKPG